MTDKLLAGKTLFITGASRGIGLAIALRAAADGANIAFVAKTDKPHPKLPGTIHTAAAEIEAAGGKALPILADVRDDDAMAAAVEKTVETFGGIDICINNASAIQLTGTLETDMKRYDLMQQVCARATFLTSKLCLPHLLKAKSPHILMLAPPLNLKEEWFGAHLAYTMAKFGMSLAVLGLAEEFKGKVCVNALWPRTTIATAAIGNILGGEEMMKRSRKPAIIADAAYLIITKELPGPNGQFFIDEMLMANHGIYDLDEYSVDPSQPLQSDLFIEADRWGIQDAITKGAAPR